MQGNIFWQENLVLVGLNHVGILFLLRMPSAHRRPLGLPVRKASMTIFNMICEFNIKLTD
jgi:hypothetical protein